MAVDDAYLQDLKNRLAPLGNVTSKKMFGGAGLFIDDRMFAKVAPSAALSFKADDKNRPEFEALGMNRSGKMPYYEATAEQMEDDEALLDAALAAAGAAERAG